MSYYRSNPRCGCARCRMSGVMAPAILITLGTLMLLQQLDLRSFHSTWPILLIVIGIVKVLQYTAPTENHLGGPTPSPMVTPPPAAPGGSLPPTSDSGDQGVRNV